MRQVAFAGQDDADAGGTQRAVELATAQFNPRAKPRIRGRPLSTLRHRRRRFVYLR